MSEEKFQIVVNGSLTEGAELEQVKQNIAKLFKTSLEKVEPMFAGRKLAVKKNLDRETAQKYKAAIIKAGLAAAIAPMAGAPAAKQAGAEKPPAGAEFNATLAATGSIMDEAPPPAEPDINTSMLGMEASGVDLDQHAPPPEPDIDVSALSMGEAGEDVTEHEEIPEPDIDISAMTMAEAGADVTEHEEVPPADIDTSELSMGEAGEDVTEHEEVPPANIDTGDLGLDEPAK
jgi:hypothetical protein